MLILITVFTFICLEIASKQTWSTISQGPKYSQPACSFPNQPSCKQLQHVFFQSLRPTPDSTTIQRESWLSTILASSLSTLRSIPSNPMNLIFLKTSISLLAVLLASLLQPHLQARRPMRPCLQALRISASSTSTGANFSPHPSYQSSVISSLFGKSDLLTHAHFFNYWDGLLLGLEKAVLKDFLAFRGHSSEGQRNPACRQVPTEKVKYIFT